MLDPDHTVAWIGQALVAIENGHKADARTLLKHAVSMTADVVNKHTDMYESTCSRSAVLVVCFFCKYRSISFILSFFSFHYKLPCIEERVHTCICEALTPTSSYSVL